jgi:hypothetical protein
MSERNGFEPGDPRQRSFAVARTPSTWAFVGIETAMAISTTNHWVPRQPRYSVVSITTLRAKEPAALLASSTCSKRGENTTTSANETASAGVPVCVPKPIASAASPSRASLDA